MLKQSCRRLVGRLLATAIPLPLLLLLLFSTSRYAVVASPISSLIPKVVKHSDELWSCRRLQETNWVLPSYDDQDDIVDASSCYHNHNDGLNSRKNARRRINNLLASSQKSNSIYEVSPVSTKKVVEQTEVEEPSTSSPKHPLLEPKTRANATTTTTTNTTKVTTKDKDATILKQDEKAPGDKADAEPLNKDLKKAEKFNQNKQLKQHQHDMNTPAAKQQEINRVQAEITAKKQQGRSINNSFWPPWPFSIFSKGKNANVDDAYLSESTADADSALVVANQRSGRRSIVWSSVRQTSQIGFRQVQLVCSQLWFHMPPGATPLLLLASIPNRRRIETLAASSRNRATKNTKVVVYKTIVPLFNNAFVRNVAFGGLGLAILSWGHYELNRKRNQTPMPLAPAYRDIKRVLLPPFLPPEERFNYFVQEDDAHDDSEHNDPLLSTAGPTLSKAGEGMGDSNDSEVSPKLIKHWNSFMDRAPKPRTWKSRAKNWQTSKQARQVERHNARRMAIYDELVALQALKKKAARLRQQQKALQEKSGSSSWLGKSYWKNGADPIVDNLTDELGYALVTGASKGIGRALAIELARWEIPLILVSRDVDRLMNLAYDIETCYGVKCCVLQADLARPGSAEKIYKATNQAGLKVDFLINNAGRAAYGLSLDMPQNLISKIVQLNTVSVLELSQLYANDMKQRNRGRVLFMSSICGAVAGLPSVALYSATKAFENSFGLALAHELEPYGVGVTTVMPGPVRGTSFKSQSRSEGALCWKIPFYAKKPEQVASWSVRAMLNGDTEATMGWQNRVFLRVMKPALPQRLHNMIAEAAWKPLPFGQSKEQNDGSNRKKYRTEDTETFANKSLQTPSPWSQRGLQSTPMLLKLPEDKPIPPPLPLSPPPLPPPTTDPTPEGHLEDLYDPLENLKEVPTVPQPDPPLNETAPLSQESVPRLPPPRSIPRLPETPDEVPPTSPVVQSETPAFEPPPLEKKGKQYSKRGYLDLTQPHGIDF